MSEDKISADKIDESIILKQIKNKLEEKNIPIKTFIAEWERLEDLEDDLTTVYINGFYDGEKKWKDKIKKDLEICKKIYEEEMKPYKTEYGLNITGLSKKEKEQLVNKRNCLLTQMKTYEMLLEG